MRALKLSLSVELVKKNLVIDFPDDDELIEQHIETAKEEVLDYLNTDFHIRDELGAIIREVEAPVRVKTWVMNRAVELYENRPAPAAELSPLRDLRVFPFRGVGL
jgi:superfamily I DNA and RNA helicase